MDVSAFNTLQFVTSVFGGLLDALTGLGGSVVIVPALELVLRSTFV
jgi:uncharacterized membrane protein YfcA